MKILITLLLTLFISSQAYAQNAKECYNILQQGKIISSKNLNPNPNKTSYTSSVYLVLWDQYIYRVNIYFKTKSIKADVKCLRYLVLE